MAKEAVQSVLDQSFSDFEIIVVDDGSSDDTDAMMSQFDGQIIYHKQENAGVAFARNKGVALSSGEYICYLDSDDLWPTDKLEKYRQVLIDHPKSTFLFSDFRKHNVVLPNPYNASNTDMFPYILSMAEATRGNIYSIEGDKLLEVLFRGYPLYPSTFVIKRELHDQYRWDPGIRRSEDFNLVLKLSGLTKFTYIHESLAIVRVHDSNKSSDFFAKNHINLTSMKLYRDLYLPESKRSLCNHYISQKQFLDGRTYLEKGHYTAGIRNILASLSYPENWKRIGRKLWERIKLKGHAHAN